MLYAEETFWGAQRWGESKTDRTYICFNREDAQELSKLSREGLEAAASPLDLGRHLREAISGQDLDCLYRELTYYPVAYPTIIEGGRAWVAWDEGAGATPCGKHWCPAATRFVKSILVLGEKRYPRPVFISTARRIVTGRDTE